MKNLILILIGIVLLTASCSSPEKSNFDPYGPKPIKILGKALPEWVDNTEVFEDFIYVVGFADTGARKKSKYGKRKAYKKALKMITADVPDFFFGTIQDILSDMGVEEAPFFQAVHNKMPEYVKLFEIKPEKEKSTCRKVIKYKNMSDNKGRKRKGCWVQISMAQKYFRRLYSKVFASRFGNVMSKKFMKKIDNELYEIEHNDNLPQAENDEEEEDEEEEEED